jgi:universal stress protein A
MGNYHKVVVAVDLEDDCNEVVKKAMSLGFALEDIALAHVFEPMPAPYASIIPYAPGLAASDDLDAQVKKSQTTKLHDVADEFGVPHGQCLMLEGFAAKELKLYAAENDVDLIIIGSHGRHGLGLMLGSTANGVLHGAPCDVLAVRIKK